jgi:hypothetical protein
MPRGRGFSHPNALRWDGGPGHYEVYYLTLTDPGTGVGIWIRYTMLAPLPGTGEQSSCSLWFIATDPRPGNVGALARKASFPVQELSTQAEPFSLRIGDATLTNSGMSGRFEDVSWELEWEPCERPYEHVHPVLRRARIAQTILVLPQPDVAINGSISFAGSELTLDGARGAQAHLYGSKHASSWAWAHCNDLRTLDGDPAPGAFVDGVSVIVPRLGHEVGPSTPMVGRIDGRDFCSTSPLRVLANASTFTLTGWRFEAIAGARTLVGEVDADRDQLAGVTYHDPDGELVYCYNSESASMRLHLYERSRRVGGWTHKQTLTAPGRAHFEYAQRTRVPDLELLTT